MQEASKRTHLLNQQMFQEKFGCSAMPLLAALRRLQADRNYIHALVGGNPEGQSYKSSNLDRRSYKGSHLEPSELFQPKLPSSQL